MSNSKIPTHWDTVSPEGEKFYTELAEKYVSLVGSDTPENLIKAFMKENVKFVNSDAGQDADASVKETQHCIIDFLTNLFEDTHITEDNVVDIWHEIFWD